MVLNVAGQGITPVPVHAFPNHSKALPRVAWSSDSAGQVNARTRTEIHDGGPDTTGDTWRACASAGIIAMYEFIRTTPFQQAAQRPLVGALTESVYLVCVVAVDERLHRVDSPEHGVRAEKGRQCAGQPASDAPRRQ